MNLSKMFVAPYTGAWIEIYFINDMGVWYSVAPYTGAWIEIALPFTIIAPFLVAPYTGAWIEIIFKRLILGNLFRRTLHGCVD